MHEKFDDVSRAVSYVASGVRSDYPSCELEVVAERRGSLTRYPCTTGQLTRILLEASKRFPMATVYYTGEEDNGQIAEIHCHCRGEKSSACCRYNHPRARVLVYVAKTAEEDPSASASGGALSGV